MSKFFKSLKKAKKEADAPTKTLAEINALCSRLVAEVGQLQYTIFAATENTRAKNFELAKLADEAKALQLAERGAPGGVQAGNTEDQTQGASHE